jgi:protein-S-isoprenylcysteine O-methyltransferase Ste14
MTNTKAELKKLIVAAVVVIVLRLILRKLGWHGLQLETRMLPSVALWMLFGVYWAIEGLNAAPTQSSEPSISTYFHQFLLLVALLMTVAPLPWLTLRFLPSGSRVVVAAGLIVQSAFLILAVWARRHLGRNWSAEVRIAVDHQLVRTGPYRFLRHPIYTAMLGMVLGTAIVSGEYHALVGLAILFIAYLRKTRLEEKILRQTFGPDYDLYRQDTWALVPPLF